MKIWLTVVFAFIMTSCASTGVNVGRHPYVDLRVSESTNGAYHFRAVIKGKIPDQYRYYCLEQLWDFGDGNGALFIPNCADYGESKGVWVPRPGYNYYREYRKKGKFKARFYLLKNNQVIMTSNSVEVEVK